MQLNGSTFTNIEADPSGKLHLPSAERSGIEGQLYIKEKTETLGYQVRQWEPLEGSYLPSEPRDSSRLKMKLFT
jgi:hypothetical protein